MPVVSAISIESVKSFSRMVVAADEEGEKRGLSAKLD